MRETHGLAYSRLVLVILLGVYSVNYMDRQIVAVLSPQIKHDLGLSDTQLGLLKGTAFALFYSTMSVPLAMLGDRINRVSLISASLTLWSAMTALCGLAGSFLQFFLIRMAVGIGEAGSTPSSHSLLADYFPRERRSTALAVYSLGVPVGTLLGLTLGAWFATQFGWRMTLLLLGLPGVPLALLVKTVVRELPRGSAEAGAGPVGTPDPPLSVVRQLWKISSYRTMVLGGSLNALVGYALSMWIVDYYVRTRAMSLAEIGLLVALAFGFGGGIGSFAGGLAADRLGRRDVTYYMTIPGLAMILAAPLMIVTVLAPSMTVSITGLFIVNGLMYTSFGPIYGLVQTLAPVKNRSFSTAFYFLFQSLIGSGVGPLAIGLLSDGLAGPFGRNQALAIALCLLAVPLLIAGAALCLCCARLRHDIPMAERALTA